MAIRLRIILATLFVLLLAAGAMPAQSEEAWDSVETRITLSANGTAEVTHRITVTAQSDAIKRGIFFDIPSALGPIEAIQVARDGAPEPYRYKDRQLRIGNKDVRLDPGQYSYDIAYRAPMPLRAEEDQALLRWRPIVAQLGDMPWRAASTVIVWDLPAPQTNSSAPGLTGGSGELRWQGTGSDAPPLMELAWARSDVPSAAVRVFEPNWTLRFLGPLLLVLILWISHAAWRRVGKDLPARPSLPHLDPPDGLSAGAARFVHKMGYAQECFAAGLASLVVKRGLTLSANGEKNEEGKLDVDSLTLTRGPARESDLAPGERAILGKLLDGERETTLKKDSSRWNAALMAQVKALKGEYTGKYFVENSGTIVFTFLLGGLAFAVLLGLMIYEGTKFEQDDWAMIPALAFGLASLIVPVIYSTIMKAPTRTGRQIMDRIDGLKAGLSQPDPLPRSEATAELYLRLMPYAVALDVEKEWAARFGEDLPEGESEDVQTVMRWLKQMQKDADDTAVFTAVYLPVIMSSSTAGSSAGVSAGAGGATAGGW